GRRADRRRHADLLQGRRRRRDRRGARAPRVPSRRARPPQAAADLPFRPVERRSTLMEEPMSNKRREILKAGAGVAAAASLPMIWVKDAHAQWSNTPEKGAKLRVLRWSRFVQGDIDQYMKSVAAFTAKTGIEVRVDNESWEDVRPKAAVAANTGAGPDIILGT